MFTLPVLSRPTVKELLGQLLPEPRVSTLRGMTRIRAFDFLTSQMGSDVNYPVSGTAACEKN